MCFGGGKTRNPPALGPAPPCGLSPCLATARFPRILAAMANRDCRLRFLGTAGYCASLICTLGNVCLPQENTVRPGSPRAGSAWLSHTVIPQGVALPGFTWRLRSPQPQALHGLLSGRSMNFPASVSLPVPTGLTQSEKDCLRSQMPVFLYYLFPL